MSLTFPYRLDLQHYCFKDLLGYNISPEIPAALLFKNDVTIADIGTGTGWVTSLVDELSFRGTLIQILEFGSLTCLESFPTHVLTALIIQSINAPLSVFGLEMCPSSILMP